MSQAETADAPVAVPVQRWALRYERDRVTIEPPEAGCRSYPCCNGEECGMDLAEAQAEIVAHYQAKVDRLKAMTPAEFLNEMGYRD